jgi:hypothetical protein
MAAQYAHLDGRRYVNADFVSKVRETYPATTKKIPLGYSTYTGWTGKDEVLFTEHQPLDDLAHLNGQLYEVTFDPSHPECFEKDILGRVSHTTVDKRASTKRPRRRAEASVEQQWGATLGEAMARKSDQDKRAQRLSRRRAFVQKILDERNVKKAAEEAPATIDEWIAWDPSAR